MSIRSPRCVAALVGLFTLLCVTQGAPQALTILHFNDLHGQLLPLELDGESRGGVSRIAAMVEGTRAWNDSRDVTTLVLAAGDILQGTPLSLIFRGEPDFVCLNMMGADAMAIGNHEFDFGQGNLAARMKQARFPVISANVRCTDAGALLADPYATMTIRGVPTLIFGLTSEDTPIESNVENVVGLEFLDPIEVAQKIVNEKRTEYPIIIALTHIGLENDIALAEAVPGIDIIIGGHSHDALPEPTRIGDTLICQAGSRGVQLGHLDAFFAEGKVARYQGFLRQVDAEVPSDPGVEAVIVEYADSLNEEIKRVIATAESSLNGVRDELRSGETNLGNLLADILRAYVDTDVAIINGGGIRASIDEGPITVEEVMRVLPFGNQLATVELTGEQLLDVLRYDASLPRPDGGFLQVSGVSMVLRGSDVADVMVGGEPLDPEATYTVALPEFLLAGGNGYTMFERGRDPRMLGTTISAIVVGALEEMGTVSPAVEGRIRTE